MSTRTTQMNRFTVEVLATGTLIHRREADINSIGLFANGKFRAPRHRLRNDLSKLQGRWRKALWCSQPGTPKQQSRQAKPCHSRAGRDMWAGVPYLPDHMNMASHWHPNISTGETLGLRDQAGRCGRECHISQIISIWLATSTLTSRQAKP
jgi:hypothetical protein